MVQEMMLSPFANSLAPSAPPIWLVRFILEVKGRDLK